MKIANLYHKAKAALRVNHEAKRDANKRFLGRMFFVGMCAFALMPEVAMAAPWDTAAESVLAIFTGGLTRTIAIISVIACGIAAIVGKLSWDWAIKIVIGIVLIFGGASIVDYIITAASATS